MSKDEYELIIKEFAEIINKHSIENRSDTPDFILAEYLFQCLQNYNKIVRKRDKWFGIDDMFNHCVDMNKGE